VVLSKKERKAIPLFAVREGREGAIESNYCAKKPENERVRGTFFG